MAGVPSHQATRTSPSFTTLPAELRNSIYELTSSNRAPSLISLTHHRIRLPKAPLLLVSKSIYQDFRTIFAQDSLTRLRVEIWDFDFDDLMEFLDSRGGGFLKDRNGGGGELQIVIRVGDSGIRDCDEVERRIHRWSHFCGRCCGGVVSGLAAGAELWVWGFEVGYEVVLEEEGEGEGHLMRALVGVWRALVVYGRGLGVVEGIAGAVGRVVRGWVEGVRVEREGEMRRRVGEGGGRLTYAEVVRRAVG